MHSNNRKKKYPVHQMTSRDFMLDTYAHVDILSSLVKDTVRTNSFQEVIYRNKHLFKGKTVLDVGCGIGLLSLFAAKAGAARVIAVDCSNVVGYAKQIVIDNHLEHIIHVKHGRIEDIDLKIKPNSVDIIISDWMGYCLVYQSILDAMIFARDKWLKPGGLIFPDKANLHVAALEDPYKKNDKINWWYNVHGFNMKSIRKFALNEPRFYQVQPDQVISKPHLLKQIDLYTVKMNDLTFASPFLIETLRSGSMDGVLTYFSVIFSKSHTPFGFKTAPWSAPTHWMQTVFFFDQPITGNMGTLYCGAFSMKPIANSLNHIKICIEILTGEPLQLVGQIRCFMKVRGIHTKCKDKVEKKGLEKLM